jgi:protease-4
MKIGKLELTWESFRFFLGWIALPILFGMTLAAFIPRPVIGVIHLEDAIYSYTASGMIAQMNYASAHPEVRAVVFMLNSPGGTVADTESVYQEMLRLRKTRPVVASVGAMAASGAYYMAVGADTIIADPTSEIGNIGVLGYLPDSPIIYEGLVSTGPYKLWGEPRDTFLREMEMIKQGFYQAVVLGRGSHLTVGPEVVLSGRIWPGTEALRIGLIDMLGSQSDAIAKAASLAHISHYQVVDLSTLAGVPSYTGSFFAQSPSGAALPTPAQSGIFLLYVPPVLVGK